MKSWLAVLLAATLAQAPPASKLEKIKDDLYVLLGEGCNVTILLTNDGVVLVDDKFERN